MRSEGGRRENAEEEKARKKGHVQLTLQAKVTPQR
jgi:hypothetical protein